MRQKNTTTNVDGIEYVPPKIVYGVRSYIEYWVYDFDHKKLVRKRKYVTAKTKKELEKKAKNQQREINSLLHKGYTLGIRQEDSKAMPTLEAFRLAVDIKKWLNGNPTMPTTAAISTSCQSISKIHTRRAYLSRSSMPVRSTFISIISLR